MDPGGIGGAFGGVKAGGQQDPLTYVKRPAVVIRIFALFFSIIVYGEVASRGWFLQQPKLEEICVIKPASSKSSAACYFATTIGSTGFLVAVLFLIVEWFFEQMSSIKSRKHYVILDMAFSGIWALFYAIAFIFMANSWRQSDEMFSFAKSNIIGAIFFAFLSVFCWLGSVGLAYQRFKAGSDTAFSQGLGDEAMGQDGNQYQGYQEDTGYSDPPFQGGGQQGLESSSQKSENNEDEEKLFSKYGDLSKNLIKGSYGTI